MARSMQKLGTYFDFLIPKKWPISKCFSGKILSSTSPEIMRSGLNSRPIACFSTTTIFFYKLQEEYKHLQASSTSNSSAPNSSSSTSTQPGNGMVPPMTSEAEILHEAKMLREHKDRLEGR